MGKSIAVDNIVHQKVYKQIWFYCAIYHDASLSAVFANETALCESFYTLSLKENGFFIECGALDGETRSNTLFFEIFRNLTGLLIEADPINYQQLLSRNRKAFGLYIQCILYRGLKFPRGDLELTSSPHIKWSMLKVISIRRKPNITQ